MNVSRFADVSPLLSLASQVSLSINQFMTVNQNVVINGGTAYTSVQYKSISETFNIESVESWVFDTYGTVYQLITLNGWISSLAQLKLYGDIQPIIIFNSDSTWAVVKYGDIEVICTVDKSTSTTLGKHLSITPVFVIVKSRSLTDEVKAVIQQILGIDDFKLWSFSTDGTIDSAFTIITTKNITLEELMDMLVNLGVDSSSLKSMVADSAISANVQINDKKQWTFLTFGNLGEIFNVNGLVDVWSGVREYVYGIISQLIEFFGYTNLPATEYSIPTIFVYILALSSISMSVVFFYHKRRNAETIVYVEDDY